MLGDAGTPNTDETYTGEVSDSTLSVDYVRNKAREFQVLMNNVDAAYIGAQQALASGALDEQSAAEVQAALDEADGKRSTLKAAAEAFNIASAAWNAAGGRLPNLSIPATLGLAPLVVPVAIIGAVGTMTALITWGAMWVSGLNDRLRRAQVLDAASPEQRAQLVEGMAQVDNASQAAGESPLQSLGTILKWGAIIGGGFLVWKFVLAPSRGRRLSM